MKTTVEIPDELYRQAKVQAARENRTVRELIGEGLSLVLGFSADGPARRLRRMKSAPVRIRAGNDIPVLSNDAMAQLLDRADQRLP